MTTDCTDTLQNLWEFIDAELPQDAIAGISRHLLLCPPCRSAEAFDRAFLDLLTRQRWRPAPRRVAWQVRVRLMEARA